MLKEILFFIAMTFIKRVNHFNMSCSSLQRQNLDCHSKTLPPTQLATFGLRRTYPSVPDASKNWISQWRSVLVMARNNKWYINTAKINCYYPRILSNMHLFVSSFFLSIPLLSDFTPSVPLSFFFPPPILSSSSLSIYLLWDQNKLK